MNEKGKASIIGINDYDNVQPVDQRKDNDEKMVDVMKNLGYIYRTTRR